MSTAKLLIKNTGILVAGEVLSRILSLILIVFIARYLGNVGLGKYSFVFAFVGIFSVLSDLGSTVYMTRELSRNASLTKEYLGKVFVIKLIAGLISCLLPVIAIMFTTQSSEIKFGVLLATVSMFFYYIAFPFRAVVNAFEIQGYQSLYVFIERLIAFALGVLAIYKGYGLIGLLVALVISNFSSWFLLYKLISKNISSFKLRFDFPFLKSFLKKSFPFWFTTIFMTIYFKIDTVMLSFLKDYAATGWYNASYKIIDTLSFLPFVIITAVFPVMAKLYRRDDKTLLMLYQKSFYYLTLLALPLGLGVTLLSDRIILFVYKQDFANSVIALRILIWALVFMFVNYLMGYLLNSIEKQKYFTFTTGFCALFNIILNFILIPFYSYIGAAIATVATEIVNFVLLFYFTYKNSFRVNILKIISKPLIATILMMFFVIYLSKFHLLLLIPLSIVIYFLIVFLIGGLRDNDKKLLQSVFRFKS